MRRMSTDSPRSALHKGFTIVELVLVMAVGSILMIMLFGPLDDLYQSNLKGAKTIIQYTDARNALRTIEEVASISTAFNNTNTVADPVGTSFSWTGGGANKRTLITTNYATTIEAAIDTNGDRTLVYSGSPTCKTPLTNNYVFFISGTTLYRRLLRNTTTPCAGYTIGQKQTCAAGYTNALCKANDAIIATNVTQFTVDYYGTSGSSTPLNSNGGNPPHTNYTDSATPGNARSIVVTLTVKNGNGANAVTSTSTLRITRANGA